MGTLGHCSYEDQKRLEQLALGNHDYRVYLRYRQKTAKEVGCWDDDDNDDSGFRVRGAFIQLTNQSNAVVRVMFGL